MHDRAVVTALIATWLCLTPIASAQSPVEGQTTLVASQREALLASLRNLRVSENHRYLVRGNGKPFFYLGDTAWELFHRLDREEIANYFLDRKTKGFTVVQCVLLAEFDGLTVPDRQGELPLIDQDPSRPNPKYFAFVDEVVALAENFGLVLGLLPTWGDKINKKWGVGPEIFTPTNAYVYGQFLGQRYKDRAVLWILGGDRIPEKEIHREIWRQMAAGLRAGGGAKLITFHPMGGRSSSEVFHQEPWLDFNMFQSGHGSKDQLNFHFVHRDRDLKPTKPTLDGEPNYEDHPIGFKAENGYFDQHDVRRAAYWGVFAGACGHTYGDHNIWQFLSPARKPITAARTPWTVAINHPGATQMGHLRRLVEAYPYWQSRPANELLVAPKGDKGATQVALADERNRFLLAYTPTGLPLTLKLGQMSSAKLKALWFDPREGRAQEIDVFDRPAQRTFTPKEVGVGKDMVVILVGADLVFPDLALAKTNF